MDCERFSAVTASFKAEVSILLVALVLHIIGISLPQLSTLKNDDYSYQRYDVQTVYRIRLWEDSTCGDHLGFLCVSIPKRDATGLFHTLQALEATGLASLIFSGICSIILLLSSENKRLKVINICLVLGAAVLIVTGCILYAVYINGNNDHMLTETGYLFGAEILRARLGASFFLCSVAGALYLIVCPTLLVIDYRTAKSVDRHEQFHNMLFSNQGQIISTPSRNVVVQYSGQLPMSQITSEAQPSPPPAYTT